MGKSSWNKQAIFAAILLLLAAGCKKEISPGDIEYPITHWPVVKAWGATNIDSTIARLNGNVDGYGLPTTVTFEYGPTASYGSTVTADESPVTQDGDTYVSAVISGLTPHMTYHYRIKAENSLWKDFYSSDSSFILRQIPTVTTLYATKITSIGATLNGIVNAHGLPTTVTFTIPGPRGSRTVTAVQSPVTGNADILVNGDISGLSPGTTYSFKVKATNSLGTFYGGSINFTLLPPCGQIPIVTTLPATNISSTGATLNGTINANGSQTTVTFEYSKNTPRGPMWITIPSLQSPITGDTDILVTADISGLGPGTTHAFKVKATNSCGTVYGNSISFTTGR